MTPIRVAIVRKQRQVLTRTWGRLGVAGAGPVTPGRGASAAARCAAPRVRGLGGCAEGGTTRARRGPGRKHVWPRLGPERAEPVAPAAWVSQRRVRCSRAVTSVGSSSRVQGRARPLLTRSFNAGAAPARPGLLCRSEVLNAGTVGPVVRSLGGLLGLLGLGAWGVLQIVPFLSPQVGAK